MIEPLANRALLTVRVGEETLRALAPHRAWADTVYAYVDPARFLWFDGDTGRRLEGETPDGSVPAARGG